jgi:hypothetical protein
MVCQSEPATQVIIAIISPFAEKFWVLSPEIAGERLRFSPFERSLNSR